MYLDLLSLRLLSVLEDFFIAVAGEAGCFIDAGACMYYMDYITHGILHLYMYPKNS